MKRNRTKGFTLIEVLVVIAIISVLATILLPSFNAARKKPYDVATQQCAKAIVTAQVTYSSEHNNQAAGNLSQLNNGDVNEQCINAGVQIMDTAPGAITAPGNNNLGYSGDDYVFIAWHQSGTSIYVIHKNYLPDHFRKIN